MPGCRLQVAGLRLSDYAGLEDCWLPGATGLSGTPGLGSRLCPEAKSRLVVIGAKVDSVPSRMTVSLSPGPESCKVEPSLGCVGLDVGRGRAEIS